LTNPAGSLAEKQTSAVAKFMKEFFGRGRGMAIPLDVTVGVDDILYGKDRPELGALGIEYIECVKDDSAAYPYRFNICVSKSRADGLADADPKATYMCSWSRLGKHPADVSSIAPSFQSSMARRGQRGAGMRARDAPGALPRPALILTACSLRPQEEGDPLIPFLRALPWVVGAGVAMSK